MEAQKHSGLGIASFIMSMSSGSLIVTLIAIVAVMEASAPGSLEEDSAGELVVGLLALAFAALSLVALGLGIGGLVQRERRKVFAALGTAFSAVTLVGMILLVIIGNAME